MSSSFLEPGQALGVIERLTGGLGFSLGHTSNTLSIKRGELPRWFASWPHPVTLTGEQHAGLVGHWRCDTFSFVLVEAIDALHATDLVLALDKSPPRRMERRPPGWMPSHVHGFEPHDLTALAYRRPRGRWTDDHLIDLAKGLGLDAVKVEGGEGGLLVSLPAAPTVPRLPFEGPFEAPTAANVVLLKGRGIVADFAGGQIRARGWGKIQYMEHAELLWRAWEQWVEEVAGHCLEAGLAASAMNAAIRARRGS